MSIIWNYIKSHLGIDLIDLELIEKSHSMYLDDQKSIINFDKGRKMSGILKRIARTLARNEVISWKKGDINPKLMLNLRNWLAANSKPVPDLMNMSFSLE